MKNLKMKAIFSNFMAQVTEFLLNLLLIKRKFITASAAETFQIALERCLNLKGKISTEYHNATQMVGNFENMLDFINYNASQYSCEEQNYIVLNNGQHQAREEQSKIIDKGKIKANHNKIDNSLLKTHLNSEKFKAEINNGKSVPDKNKSFKAINSESQEPNTQVKSHDYILDNLHAILKTQEILFKNFVKLVILLEKDEAFNVTVEKLSRIKNKLTACRDVLTQTSNAQKFSDLINNIIEDEITRCNFKHGQSKIAREIKLKVLMPNKGIATILEASKNDNIKHKNEYTDQKKIYLTQSGSKVFKINRQNEILKRDALDSEIKIRSKVIFRRTKSEPTLMTVTNKLEKKENPVKFELNQNELLDFKKVIEINTKCFHQFEEALWHSLTSLKYMALQHDHINRSKCAFCNEEHFLKLESVLLKQTNDREQREENKSIAKLLSVSESMFQIVERQLFLTELKEQITTIKTYPLIFEKKDTKTDQVQNQNIMKKDLPGKNNENKCTEINTPKTSQNQKEKDIKQYTNFQEKIAPTHDRFNNSTFQRIQATIKPNDRTQNALTNDPHNVEKQKKQDESKKCIQRINVLATNYTEQNVKQMKDGKRKQNISVEKNRAGKVKELTIKFNLSKMTKNISGIKSDHKTIANQLTTNPEEKVLKAQDEKSALTEEKNNTNHLSATATTIKAEADLIYINQKVFDKMEKTLHTVQNFIKDNSANGNSSNIVKTSIENMNRNPKASGKKNLSTTASITITVYNDNKVSKSKTHVFFKKNETRSSAPTGRTFVKMTEKDHVEKSNEYIKPMSLTRKAKTFLKSSTQHCIWAKNRTIHTHGSKISKPTLLEIMSVNRSLNLNKAIQNIQMRRTTKTAMKKQQGLRTLPKSSKSKSSFVKLK